MKLEESFDTKWGVEDKNSYLYEFGNWTVP